MYLNTMSQRATYVLVLDKNRSPNHILPCDPTKSKPYLCSTALFRRSFSLFSTAASGPTWEIFSSSVPLMLDAWLVEGVSRPDS